MIERNRNNYIFSNRSRYVPMYTRNIKTLPIPIYLVIVIHIYLLLFLKVLIKNGLIFIHKYFPLVAGT